MSLRADTRRVTALTKRDLHINVSYHFQLFIRGFSVALTLAMFFFIGRLVGDSPYTGEYTGGYFEFALVGLVVGGFAYTCVSSFTSSVQMAQTDDTFEILLATPSRLSVLMAGTLVVPLLFSALDGALYMGIGWVLAEHGFNLSGLLLASLAVVLLLGTFCALGLFSAALIVLTKRGDPISKFGLQASNLLAGALFPVAVLPEFLQSVSRLVPAFYGLRAIREVLLSTAGLGDIAGDLLVLLGFNVVLLPIGLKAFGKAVRMAKVTGTLGNQ